MRVLYVCGCDYAPTLFTDNFDIDYVVRQMDALNINSNELHDTNGNYIEVTIYEFGEVCPEFIDFIYAKYTDIGTDHHFFIIE